MSQVLVLDKDKHLVVDRSWRDNGEDPRWAFIGGQRTLIKEGSPALPEIFQRGTDFFYKDGSPVTKTEDVSYLPEPYRTQAETFVEKSSGKPQKLISDKNEALVQALLPAKKGRGRPKKEQPKASTIIALKDAESYAALGGVEPRD